MLSVYPACFYKDRSGYSVFFPDLNLLSTRGNTEKEAMDKAVECLAGHLYIQKKDGKRIARASSIRDISVQKIARKVGADPETGYVTLIPVDVDEYASIHFEKSVRKTLTIPAWLNIEAQKKNINFSQTLQEALIAKVRS